MAGATGGVSTAVNLGTQAVTGVGGWFGIGHGRTDAVMEADKKIMGAIGCSKYIK